MKNKKEAKRLLDDMERLAIKLQEIIKVEGNPRDENDALLAYDVVVLNIAITNLQKKL
jgi:hypothetical protein